MYGIMPDAISPAQIRISPAVAANMDKAGLDMGTSWQDLLRKRVFNVIYIDGGDDDGAFDVRLSWGRWRI